MQVDRLCFCKRELMSICTAGNVDEQKKCQFYQKSSYSDRCMYFMFDEFCDCLEAQTSTAMQKAPEFV